MHLIPAHVLDEALSNVSDVPTVEVENGTLSVAFTGNYENPVNDLVEFLAALQRRDERAAEAAREGLSWEEGGYSSQGTARLNGLGLEAGTVSDYQVCDCCGDRGDLEETAGGALQCEECRDAEPEPMDMSGGSGGSDLR